MSPLKLVRKQSIRKLLWPLLKLNIFQISLKASVIVKFALGPMVGSSQLLQGIGLSGELAETWPNLLPPYFPWGSCLM